MNTRKHARGASGGRGGFTIVELLMALLLGTMLLTAIAVVMRASLYTYEQNQSAAAVNQASRALAMRIQRELRQAEAVDYTAGNNKIIITPPTNTDGLQEIVYDYVSGDKTLTYSLNYTDTSKNTTSTLFDPSSEVELSSFYVTYNVTQNDQGLWCTQRVVCTTYYTIDGQTSPLVFTASPRRNLTY